LARIELEQVTKRYPGGVPAVNNLTLDIPDGDFVVLVGPSGSGKTTALRMVAGMVSQNYGLYPHLTVEENVAFGLQLRKTPQG
jgi:multiple sugar transport system ATP-binding protein